MLRSALVPVEPSEALGDRVVRTLSELTGAAADELADWELSAMRDPRNWARPATAAVIGGTAAGALVLARARQAHKRRSTRGARALGRSSGGPRALERSLRGVSGGLRRRIVG